MAERNRRGLALNVLHVNMSIDPVLGGGTAERTLQLCRQLTSSGHGSSLLALDIGLGPELKSKIKSEGILATYLPCIFRRFYVPAPLLGKMARAVKQADVVHLMGHWTLINALVFFLCVFYKKPYVVCPAGALRIFGRSKGVKKLYNLLVGRAIIQNAKACVAVTDSEVADFKEYGVASDDVILIPNGVNAEDYKERDDLAFKKKHKLFGRLMVLFMGRLNEIKGPDLLVEAFLRLKDDLSDVDLVFAGPDGGLLSALQERSNSIGKSNIHFLGYVGGAEKSQAYHAADILVIPSRLEAMSIVVLEAGVTSTPVIITDQCGFDVVESVGGGTVVPATVEGIASGLEKMIEKGNLAEIGERLNKFVLENYSWSTSAGKYVALYQNILSK